MTAGKWIACSALACSIWICLSRPMLADDPAGKRWAIISSSSERDQAIADLLTARLSQFKDIQLVERETIRRVLDELKLNAGGLVDLAKTVQLGRLTAADALVLIHHETRSKPPLFRVRVIESRSGARITDLLLDAGDVEQETSRIEAALTHAHLTVDVDEGNRRYIGLLGIGNEEPGQLLTPVARSLSVLVAQDLNLVPTLVVLEREQLQRLTAERNLTALEQKLRGSTVLVEGGMRRRSDQEGYRITLKLVFLNGKPTRDLVVTTDAHHVAAVRRAVSSAIEAALGTEVEKRSADPGNEALLFARRCDWLRSVDRHDEAISLAEAALALEASAENYHRACSTHYSVAHFHNRLAKHEFDKVFRKLPVDRGHDELHLALTAARRTCELELELIKIRRAEKGHPAGVTSFSVFSPWIVQPRDDDRRDNQQLRQEVDRLQLEKYRVVFDVMKRGKQNLAGLLIRRLAHAARLAESPAEFCEIVRTLVPQIDSEIQVAASNRQPGLKKQYIEALIKTVNHARHEEDHNPVVDTPRQWPLQTVTPLFRWLTQHSDANVRCVGYYGLCLLPGEEGTQAATKALDTSNLTDVSSQLLDGALSRAVGNLKRAGQDEKYFDQWLARAEQAGEPETLIRWPRMLFWFTVGNKKTTAAWNRRCLQLLAKGKFQGAAEAQADHLRRRLTQQLADIEQLSRNHVKGNPVAGAWQDYIVQKIKFQQPADYTQFIGVHIDRHPSARRRGGELVLVWNQKDGKSCAGRASIEGGELRQIGGSFPHAPVSAAAGWRIKIATSPNAVFVASGSPGFTMLRDNKTRVFTQDDGAPADQILAMAWLKDALYISFASSLARFDPRNEEFTLIASSLSVQTRSALDGGSRYFIRGILPHEESESVYLDIHASTGSPRSGIWKYEPASGQLERVFDASRKLRRSKAIWSDEDVFLMADGHWYLIDAKTAKVRTHKDHAFFHQTFKGRLQATEFIKIGQDIIGANGQIYTPDGKEYRRPMTWAWQIVGRFEDGAVVANFDTSVNSIWYIKPRRKESSTKQ